VNHPDVADAIYEALDGLADHESFLPLLFEVMESYLADEISFTSVDERAEVKERLIAALLVMGKRLLAFHPAAVAEA
jgi:hypothetical protein